MNESELNAQPEISKEEQEIRMQDWERRLEQHHRRSRIWMGAFILLVGLMALLKSFNLPLPEWLFTWQMLIIGFGIFIGLRHRFKGGAWILPILVGLAFLMNDYFLQLDLRKHIWPLALILAGLALLLKPRGPRGRRCRAASRRWREKRMYFRKAMMEGKAMMEEETRYNREDFLDSISIFGASKKKIITKDFKGGDIVNVFGGTELDLSQADVQGRAELEVVAIFGGASLIVPSNWIIKSEILTLFGGIQDKRTIQSGAEQSGKILLLKGTVIFGGIEIKSF